MQKEAQPRVTRLTARETEAESTDNLTCVMHKGITTSWQRPSQGQQHVMEHSWRDAEIWVVHLLIFEDSVRSGHGQSRSLPFLFAKPFTM